MAKKDTKKRKGGSTALVRQGDTQTSALAEMASRLKVDGQALLRTVKDTVIRASKNGREPTNEDLLTFIAVANEYHLNPLTREIFAFPGKGGGVIPIVSIDGWVSLIQRNEDLDGITFEDHLHEDDGHLTAITCRIHRKGMTHPIEVTEYMRECKRNTEPWQKWPRRMLRHKSLIQCGRIAYGYSGIYDEDEGERIIEGRVDVVDTNKPKVPEVGELTAGDPADRQDYDDGDKDKKPPVEPEDENQDVEPEAVGAVAEEGEPVQGTLDGTF